MRMYGALILVCMWGSMWAAALDKPEAYKLGALIKQSKLTASFDPKTDEGSYIAYQVGPQEWKVGKLGKLSGRLFDIKTGGKKDTVAAAGNLRNIK